MDEAGAAQNHIEIMLEIILGYRLAGLIWGREKLRKADINFSSLGNIWQFESEIVGYCWSGRGLRPFCSPLLDALHGQRNTFAARSHLVGGADCAPLSSRSYEPVRCRTMLDLDRDDCPTAISLARREILVGALFIGGAAALANLPPASAAWSDRRPGLTKFRLC
jgi:hypothetical protein